MDKITFHLKSGVKKLYGDEHHKWKDHGDKWVIQSKANSRVQEKVTIYASNIDMVVES